MDRWLEIFYFSIFSSTLLLSLLGVWFTVIIPGIDRWSKRFFLSYFIVFILCCFFSFIELITYYIQVTSTVMYLILFVETLFLSMPVPMLTAYLLHYCGENITGSRLFKIALGLWAVYFVMLVSNPFHDGFIIIHSNGHYQRGPVYAILLLPMITIQLLNLTDAIRRRKKLSHKAFCSFLTAILPMTTALIVLMFVEAFLLLDISYVLSALSMYSFILSDQIEQNLRHQQRIAEQQGEIARQRVNVMVLQMRPHFIFNTLMSIHSLCRLDPQKAQQTTMDFTNYLRRNFNAIASDSTIPFSTELEHTRAYLAVEQAQHGAMLSVDYDTPFTHFRLPALTLQPIVENAVKHGMDPYHGPLCISIRTQSTDFGVEIIVEDNGSGFDTSDNGEPHLALKNIQQRLEFMCDGSLAIIPRDEGGTVVTITIPLRKE